MPIISVTGGKCGEDEVIQRRRVRLDGLVDQAISPGPGRDEWIP
jgi:hypothetical protein